MLRDPGSILLQHFSTSGLGSDLPDAIEATTDPEANRFLNEPPPRADSYSSKFHISTTHLSDVIREEPAALLALAHHILDMGGGDESIDDNVTDMDTARAKLLREGLGESTTRKRSGSHGGEVCSGPLGHGRAGEQERAASWEHGIDDGLRKLKCVESGTVAQS